MGAAKQFQEELVKWLCKNNCSNTTIFFDSDFQYAIDNETNECAIGIGVFTSSEMLNWYKQFLYEYGGVQTSVLDIVLPFLHEVGHYFTFSNFDDFELMVFNMSKTMTCENDSHMTQEQYWLVPDEMAANVWAINFINTHPNAMEELNEIFFMYWEDMIAEIIEQEED